MYTSLCIGTFIIGVLLNWLFAIPYLATFCDKVAKLYGIPHTSQELFVGAYIIYVMVTNWKTSMKDVKAAQEESKAPDSKAFGRFFGVYIFMPFFKMFVLWLLLYVVTWYHGHLFN